MRTGAFPPIKPTAIGDPSSFDDDVATLASAVKHPYHEVITVAFHTGSFGWLMDAMETLPSPSFQARKPKQGTKLVPRLERVAEPAAAVAFMRPPSDQFGPLKWTEVEGLWSFRRRVSFGLLRDRSFPRT